ncbi:hypothetical protein SLA2020_363000 [Shorea laevis]
MLLRCGMQLQQILSCWFFLRHTETLFRCQGIGVRRENICRGSVVLRSNLFNFPISLLQQELRRSDRLILKKRTVLHDAFFKYQTKPKLTHHGDLYHEGKEFEVKLREMKPGTLSHELKEALGMPEGAPPPLLINMQRYGPPPSYPHLKIG